MNIFAEGKFSAIRHVVPLFSGYILDIGCGSSRWHNKIAELRELRGTEYIGLDVNKDMLSGSRYQVVVGEGCHLPFSTSFDLILLLDVIEHLREPSKILSECERVLKPKGFLLVSTPNKLSFDYLCGRIRQLITGKKYVAWDASHKQIFSSIEFISVLKERFDVIKIVGYWFLPWLPFSLLQKISAMMIMKTWPFNLLGFLAIVLVRER